MAKKVAANLRQWALIGAEQRLLQLAEEAAQIHREFPELRRGQRRANAAESQEDVSRRQVRRRGRMSAAARKRISDAQKARWAKHRSKNG
jgi:hypothetical protein